jgi:hypothetical protein
VKIGGGDINIVAVWVSRNLPSSQVCVMAQITYVWGARYSGSYIFGLCTGTAVHYAVIFCVD